MLRKCCRFCACHETKGVREEKAIPISKCLVRRLCNAAGRRKRKQRLFPQSTAMPSHSTPMLLLSKAQCVVLLLRCCSNPVGAQASCSARDRSCKKEGKGVLQRFTIHAVFPRRLSIRPGLDWTRGQPIKVGVAGCLSRNGMRFEELPTSQVEAVSRRVSELRRWRHGRCEWDSLMVGAA